MSCKALLFLFARYTSNNLQHKKIISKVQHLIKKRNVDKFNHRNIQLKFYNVRVLVFQARAMLILFPLQHLPWWILNLPLYITKYHVPAMRFIMYNPKKNHQNIRYVPRNHERKIKSTKCCNNIFLTYHKRCPMYIL